MNKILLEVNDLNVFFPVKTKGFLFGEYTDLKAIDGVSFKIYESETLGLVGESGCGKSTLARSILRLINVSNGSISWLGSDITIKEKKELNSIRKDLQIVFQDPLASLNPRMTVGEIISEPLINYNPNLNKDERRFIAEGAMEKVGLSHSAINRYPHEFSGGQCQRIGIARAMVLKPKLIICDEPVSALDVSIQAQVINLLMKIQKKEKIALLFISHDLAVVKHISHRIMVLYLGKIMELADSNEIYKNPLHPYTKALLSAIPIPDPVEESKKNREIIIGEPPSPLSPPSGCVFRNRCSKSNKTCSLEIPTLQEASPDHYIACHYWI